MVARPGVQPDLPAFNGTLLAIELSGRTDAAGLEPAKRFRVLPS
jgi:hypothetical protein